MPRLGAEPIRKAALVKAAIATVGRARSLDVTVAQIAAEAGMSPALAHHYFGSKERIFLAAMRHLLTLYRTEVAAATAAATTPRARAEAILTASFAPKQFDPETVAAWLNFYVLAQSSPEAARLLRVYHARLRSNLRAALRGLTPAPEALAERLGALIDGLYLRAALTRADSGAALAILCATLDEAARDGAHPRPDRPRLDHPDTTRGTDR